MFNDGTKHGQTITTTFWKGEATEFQKLSQVDSNSAYFPKRSNGQWNSKLTKEETLTEARKIVRKEKYKHVTQQRKDKVIDNEIYQIKINFENGRLLRQMQMENVDDISSVGRKNNHSKDFSLHNWPTSTMAMNHIKHNGIILKTSNTVSKNCLKATALEIVKNEEKNRKIIRDGSIKTSPISHEIVNIIEDKSNPIASIEFQLEEICKEDNEEENVVVVTLLPIKKEISGSSSCCGVRLDQNHDDPLRLLRHCWFKWKRHYLLNKAKKVEGRRWQERIDKFVKRLRDRSKLEADEIHKISQEENVKVEKNIKVEQADLQLTELGKAIKQSALETRERLQNRSIRTINPQLRGKARLIRVMTEVQDKRKNDNQVKPKPFPKPKILVESMEKQVQRRQRLSEIQERKRQIEEERDRIAQEKYERQLEEAMLEKKRKLDEFKAKMRNQRIEREKRKQEWLRMKFLDSRAVHLYQTKLVTKLGLIPWLRLVEIRWEQNSAAAAQNERRLKRTFLTYWKSFVQEIQEMKEMKALSLWRRRVLRTCVTDWRKACRERQLEWQVAQDWYDFYLLRRYFENWEKFVVVEREEQQKKWHLALKFYKRNETLRHLKQWMLLPQVNYLEREKESRRRVLREKIQQILPDFQPFKTE